MFVTSNTLKSLPDRLMKCSPAPSSFKREGRCLVIKICVVFLSIFTPLNLRVPVKVVTLKKPVKTTVKSSLGSNSPTLGAFNALFSRVHFLFISAMQILKHLSWTVLPATTDMSWPCSPHNVFSKLLC